MRNRKNNNFIIKNRIEDYNNIINYKNNNKLIFKKIFNNDNKIIIDIGFGNSNFLLNNCIKNKNINFIGIEKCKYSVHKILFYINKLSINNIKIINFDVKHVLNNMLLYNSVYEIRIFFPDIWYKKKHNKRKIVNILLIRNIINILQENCYLHIITDSYEYLDNIINNLDILYKIKKNFELSNLICYTNKLVDTFFEKRAILLKKNIYYLKIKKIVVYF